MIGAVTRIPLFAGMSPQLIRGIANAAGHRIADANETIYWQGDEPDALYFVASGHVRLAIASPEGDEKVIDIVSAGRHFGVADLFSAASYASFAEAVAPTKLIEIDKDALLSAVATDRELSLRLLRALADQYASVERDLAASHFESVTRRLLNYLLAQAGDLRWANGECELELAVSKRHIASRLGTTAESLSRAFRELSEIGLIRVRGRRVVFLDSPILRSGGRAALAHRAPRRSAAARPGGGDEDA